MELLSMESILTTQLKVRVPKLLNNAFPNISFTNEISDKTPSFPNVYIHELEPSELGTTLVNQNIRAIRETIQIDVTTNTTKADDHKVANACVNSLKALSFSIQALPVYTKNNNVHRYIIRAQRVIANGDNF
jgi:hypothetical protein